MMKPFLKLFLAFLPLTMACGPRPAAVYEHGPGSHELSLTTLKGKQSLSGFASPKAVVGTDSLLYVSNVGKEPLPLQRDRDGFISKLDKEGHVLSRRFIPNLNAPKGLAILDSLLYVSDIDQVRVFQRFTGDSLDNFDLSALGVKFLNDLCPGDSGFLYASATLQNKVYRIDVLRRTRQDPVSEVFIPKNSRVQGVNGLWYDRDMRDLYLAGFGDPDSSNGCLAFIPRGPRAVAPRSWNGYQGKLDGLVVSKSKAYITDWTGLESGESLWEIDLGTGKATPLGAGRIGGAADFWYDETRNIFWIPSMTESKLYVFRPSTL